LVAAVAYVASAVAVENCHVADLRERFPFAQAVGLQELCRQIACWYSQPPVPEERSGKIRLVE